MFGDDRYEGDDDDDNDESECSSPWKKVHRICMKFVKQQKSFSDAKVYCENEGGHLLSITSVAKKVRFL